MLEAFNYLVVYIKFSSIDVKLIYCQYLVLFVIVISNYSCTSEIFEKHDYNKDQVSLWLKRKKNSTGTRAEKKIIIDSAYHYTKAVSNDSLKYDYLSKVASAYLKIKDSGSFRIINAKIIEYALKEGETELLAESHWNYAIFHLRNQRFDSSYIHYKKAYELYEIAGHSYYSGKMLYHMAIIQSRIKNYTLSEVLLIASINYFEPLGKYKQLALCYNLLGIIQSKLKEPDNALSYYKTAMRYIDRLDNEELLKSQLNNNIGVLFREKTEYTTALAHFNQALQVPELSDTYSAHLARIIDNIAYTKLLMGDPKVKADDFNESLQIRKSNQDHIGIVTGTLHLAEFYAIKKDTAQAIFLAEIALQISRRIKSHSETLKCLTLLSELDIASSNHYLKAHKTLSDKIYLVQSKVHNKFARIQYETQEYREQARALQNKNYHITAFAVLVIVVLTKIILDSYQSSKLKVLKLKNIQKNIEERILKLENENFSGQQKERLRISNILHTEVMGSLSVLRLKWFRLYLNGSNEQIREQLSDIDLLHKVEKTLRDLSKGLYSNANSFETDFVNDITGKFKSRCDDAKIAFQLHTDQYIQWETITLPIKIKLYYIISESLNNCIKYANARHFKVVFYGFEPGLHFVIRDDGSGFIKSETKASLGLKLMHRNIEEIHGKIVFYPQPGIGTRIHGRIPTLT